jgi:hypothetical protein
MGAIARNIANKITTSGVFTSGAIANSSVTGITVLANASDGITFISSQTANNSASISFTTGLDSTYKAYKFVFVNCKPATSGVTFQMNLSTDGGSNYNVTKTTTVILCGHFEDDSATALSYSTANDLAQGTGYQILADYLNNNSDSHVSGSMLLFNPSSTTYVKHFISRVQGDRVDGFCEQYLVAGYGNTTSAVNAIRFQMSSGNISAGTIYLYGIK